MAKNTNESLTELAMMTAHVQTLQNALIVALEALTTANPDPLANEKAIVHCELALEVTGMASTVVEKTLS